jgi:Raf kinase inhibitor-like YbhB/YbcL family protein
MMQTPRRFVICGILAGFSVGSTIAQTAVPVSIGASGVRGGSGRSPRGPGLTLKSPAFEDGGIIPPKFTSLNPDPVSPKLEWTNVPAAAAFVLIMHDPDMAREGRIEDVLHWLVINIPGTARELPEGVPNVVRLDDGSIQPKPLSNGTASTVKNGFMAPGAPAAGPYHHYTFELFALDGKMDLTGDATRADVLMAMEGHIVAKAVLVGRFHR